MSAGGGYSRRRFLTTSTGLVIGFVVAPKSRLLGLQEAGATRPAAPKPLPPPNAFLRIGEDDTVTVILAHSEMGQGVWTTLPMLIAEELECDWSKIRVETAPAAPVYAHTGFGAQMTGGSSSTYSEYDRYRQVGAMARAMLIAAAAAQWKVAPTTCHAENGFVVSGTRRASFGSLAKAAEAQTPPAAVTLKDRKDWKILGKPTQRLDSPQKVTGAARFGIDVHEPDMKTALVARPPVFRGKVRAFRAEKAKAVPGVRAVVEVPSGVAVVADHFWAAKLGREALEVDWDLGEGAALDTPEMKKQYAALAATSGARAAARGNPGLALASVKNTVEASYEFPFLAHATMEPLNCAVRLSPGKCEIWTGTQFQTGDQMAAAKIAGVKPEQVELHTTFLGGGFGRRANPNNDFVAEAVHVAKAAGVPVKVVWTREDDLRGGYYRPMWAHSVRVGLGENGKPLAWIQQIVGQSILDGSPFAAMIKEGIDETSVEGVVDSPYIAGTPHHFVGLHTTRSAVPVLWWRSVGHTHTAFVMETMVDALAAAAGKDPVAYRRELLAGSPRHLGVLEHAVAKAGPPPPAGQHRGVAVHHSFESYVAEVADVSVDKGKIRVHRVVCAVDCGIAINPAGIRAQIESAVVYGLSAALYGEITLKEGRVVQGNFDDYPVLRMNEMPNVEVHIVDSAEKSGGIGEPGTPPIAPAVANAVFAATGKRLRQLPLRLA
ncbi:MAG TPA: xanthine dehydrogenase family protein molybdopterin-binding subunit [Thermoanaerobaculia bacterium]|nr:xanthine dehydrogenase family protein molybdopterin-binding subunit [Thermoanaerobaculia bacterium]